MARHWLEACLLAYVMLRTGNADAESPPRTFYVSPDARLDGDGSWRNPWNLRIALAHPAAVQPGDSILVLPGTYRGTFVSTLSGTSSQPIHVIGTDGRVTIDDRPELRLAAAMPGAQPGSEGSMYLSTTSGLIPGIVLTVDDEDVQITSAAGSSLVRVRRGVDGSCAAACFNHSAATQVRMTGSTLTINGGNVWFQSIEILNSDPSRTFSQPGSNPDGRRHNGVDVYGPNVKLINLLIHDTGQAVGMWVGAINCELYGSILYNDGWYAPDRAHGHSIYAQNRTGVTTIRDNIVFNPFAYGVHIYGTSAAPLNNFVLDGNAHMNAEFLVGGQGPANNIVITSNYLYNSALKLGYSNEKNRGLEVSSNILPSGIFVDWWAGAVIHDNLIANKAAASDPQDAVVRATLRPDGHTSDLDWFGNRYVPARQDGMDFYLVDQVRNASRLSLDDWLHAGWRQTGVPKDHAVRDYPPQQVFVRRNQYDHDLAHVIIYNWATANYADVDLSELDLQPADRLVIHNAQNYWAEQFSISYAGTPVRFPLTGWTVAAPIGMAEPVAPSTFPTFAVFVVEREHRRTPVGTGRNS